MMYNIYSDATLDFHWHHHRSELINENMSSIMTGLIMSQWVQNEPIRAQTKAVAWKYYELAEITQVAN